MLNTRCTADESHVGQLYKIRLNHVVKNKHPNLSVISTMHRMDDLVTSGIHLIILNLGIEDLWLAKDTVMAHLDVQEIDISETTTQTMYDSGYESSDEEEDMKEQDEPVPSSFNTSPADIETHRKVELKDKKIDKKYKDEFEALCEKYKDIFSVDSTDIGRIPLLQMEIETGDSPPLFVKSLIHWLLNMLNGLKEK